MSPVTTMDLASNHVQVVSFLGNNIFRIVGVDLSLQWTKGRYNETFKPLVQSIGLVDIVGRCGILKKEASM